jgi:hypothetical protein
MWNHEESTGEILRIKHQPPGVNKIPVSRPSRNRFRMGSRDRKNLQSRANLIKKRPENSLLANIQNRDATHSRFHKPLMCKEFLGMHPSGLEPETF